MASLFIPDTGHTISLDTIPNDVTLVDFEWSELEKIPLSIESRQLLLKKSALGNRSTPYEILHGIIDSYEHSKLNQMKDETSIFHKYDGLYPKLTNMALTFRWKDNGDLFWDNENTFLGSFSPRMTFNKFLALKMGWIIQKESGGYELGPNLIPTVLKYHHGTKDRPSYDLHNEWIDKGWGSRDTTSYWGVAHNTLLYLSIAASWTFVVHNNISQHGSQLIQIRSNIIQSSLFNKTLLNLLAEVIYKRENNGMVHIEPNTVRYIPVRHPHLDIVEIALFDILGQPLHLKGALTRITLHFKQRDEFLPHSPQFCPSRISKQQAQSLLSPVADETCPGRTMESGIGQHHLTQYESNQ